MEDQKKKNKKRAFDGYDLVGFIDGGDDCIDDDIGEARKYIYGDYEEEKTGSSR